MRHTESLKKNRDFRAAYAGGRQTAGRLLVLYVRANGLSNNRLGITVGRKVGGAVVRNKVKRRVREAFRLLGPTVSPGYDLVFVARVAAGASAFCAIDREIRRLLLKQGLFIAGTQENSGTPLPPVNANQPVTHTAY